MRRPRSSLVLASFLLVLPSIRLIAQSGSAGEGALDLLVPTGARALGMGQVALAAARGTDALWWNPALIARAVRREVAYSFAQSLLAVNDNALTALVPVKGVGGAALAVRDIDYGQQPVTDTVGAVGLLGSRSLIAIASFGAPIGPAAIGLSFKVFREGFSCSGECPNSVRRSPITSAIDVGAHYGFTLGQQSIEVGASVVNLGRDLQVRDAPQADPLPSRAQAGVTITPRFASMPSDVSVLVGTDVITRLNGTGSPGLRVGGELSWQERYHLRGGYVVHAATGSGLSLGVGLSTGRFQLDLARFVSDLVVPTRNPPTYLTLRYQF